MQGLSESERGEALLLMTLIEGGRGIDPLRIPELATASPPSHDPLPSETAGALSGVIASLESWRRPDLKLLPMPPADPRTEEGADLLLRIAGFGIALRLVERVPAGDWTDDPELSAIADRIFLHAPETSAVAFVGTEPGNPSVIVDPQEARDAIELRKGDFVPARFRRVALPLELALTRFLEEVEVSWEPVSLSGQIESDFGVEAEVLRAALDVVAGLCGQGRRAHIPEKKSTWSSLGDREVQAVVRLVARARLSGLHGDSLGVALDELVEGAA